MAGPKMKMFAYILCSSVQRYFYIWSICITNIIYFLHVNTVLCLHNLNCWCKFWFCLHSCNKLFSYDIYTLLVFCFCNLCRLHKVLLLVCITMIENYHWINSDNWASKWRFRVSTQDVTHKPHQSLFPLTPKGRTVPE